MEKELLNEFVACEGFCEDLVQRHLTVITKQGLICVRCYNGIYCFNEIHLPFYGIRKPQEKNAKEILAIRNP